LIWAIGRDASKDWECSNIEEEAWKLIMM
jgi:hypothetical protein